MYIDKELWKKLKENVDNLYWDIDRMSTDGVLFLKEINNYIKCIEKTKSNKIYIINTNAIADSEVSYGTPLVTTNEKEAKEMFKQAVKDAKCDFDYDNLDLANEDDEDCVDDIDGYFSESDDSFSLYIDGEYSKNNISVRLIEYDIDKMNNKEEDICL